MGVTTIGSAVVEFTPFWCRPIPRRFKKLILEMYKVLARGM